MSTNYNTIVLKGADNRRVSEYQAGVAINPGYLCKLYSSTTLKVKPNDVAAVAKIPKLFAIEQEYIAKGITTQYAIADTVMLHAALPGDMIYAKLAASATAITLGDMLEPSNDGTLRKASTAPTDPAITDSTGGTASTTFAAITAPGANATTSLSADMLAVKNALAQVALSLNDMANNISGQPGAIAQAIDTVDNSGGSGEVFIRVMIL